MNYHKIHKNKILKLEEKLLVAKMKREERNIKKEIIKTYLPSLSIQKINIKFTKLSVIISFLAVCIYTAFSILLQYKTAMEVSPTLTGCVFAFFGTELVAVTSIKNKQTKCNIDTFQHENISL